MNLGVKMSHINGPQELIDRDHAIVAEYPYIAALIGKGGFNGDLDTIYEMLLTNMEKDSWRFTWYDEVKTFCFFFKAELDANLFLTLYGNMFERIVA